jgi:hypothetical protein
MYGGEQVYYTLVSISDDEVSGGQRLGHFCVP